MKINYCQHCGASLGSFSYNIRNAGFVCPACNSVFEQDDSAFTELKQYKKAFAEAEELGKSGYFKEAFEKINSFKLTHSSDEELHQFICKITSANLDPGTKLSQKAFFAGYDSWRSLEYLGGINFELDAFRQRVRRTFLEKTLRLKRRGRMICLADIAAILSQMFLMRRYYFPYSVFFTIILISVAVGIMWHTRSDPYHIRKRLKLLSASTNPFELLEKQNNQGG